VGVVQPPLPSHTEGLVRIPLAHNVPAHIALAPGYVHAVRVVPSQLPRQVSVVPAQAVLVPCGTPVTALHLPGFAVVAHASH